MTSWDICLKSEKRVMPSRYAICFIITCIFSFSYYVLLFLFKLNLYVFWISTSLFGRNVKSYRPSIKSLRSLTTREYLGWRGSVLMHFFGKNVSLNFYDKSISKTNPKMCILMYFKIQSHQPRITRNALKTSNFRLIY